MTALADLVAANPFPGLRPYAASESDRFFGRQQQIEELSKRIDEVSFLAVAGTSGCGKSSLVRAGLLSELASRVETRRHFDWRHMVMRPGNRPIANLAEHLLPLLSPDSAGEASRMSALYGRLTLGGLALAEEVKLACPDPRTRILIVVDQFEEIFRFHRMTGADDAGAFLKLLLHAAADPESKVKVVITLRSDALGKCADFRDLPEAINQGLYLVPKLTREQRKQAIVKPVELRGFRVAPRLVQRLLNDVSDSFDDLPVMQHVLARTWNRWAQACLGNRDIDLEDYEHVSVGTARNALSRHADEALESLAGLEAVTERVFRALTERVADSTEITDVRRPLEFNQLCEVVGAETQQVTQVVERYRRADTAFLMPSPETPLLDNPPIDISHESLMRQWRRLRDWIATEAESRATVLKLVDAATAHSGGTGSLWRGRELRRALDWRAKTRPTPAWAGLYVAGGGDSTLRSVEAFLDAARRAQLIRRLLAGSVSILMLLAANWIFTLSQLQRDTNSRALANQAVLLLDLEPAKSAHLARAALDQDADNVRAEYALRQAITNLEMVYTERILPHEEPVTDARYTRDGSRLVTASGKHAQVFDTKTFERIGEPVERSGTIKEAWLLADHTTLVTFTEDGHAQIQRIGDPNVQELSCVRGSDDSVYTTIVSADERHVAVGCYNGDVRVWDLKTPAAAPQEFPAQAEDVTITALAFSANDDYLASGDAGGVVGVWKLGHREVWIGKGARGAKESPLRHENSKAVRSVRFHPTDTSFLVTSGDDNQAIVWKLDLQSRRLSPNTTKEPAIWRLLHDRLVIQARFAVRADSSASLFTVSDKIVRVWIDATKDPKQARSHDDWVNDANASADGELLVTASDDGTARIWSTRVGAPLVVLRGHRDSVLRAVISPDGNQVATSSSDRTVRLWRIRLPRLVLTTERWALSAAFEPEGKRIAIGQEGFVSIFSPSDDVVRLKPNDAADQISGLSWSKDRTLLAGQRSSYGLNTSDGPCIWNVGRGQEVTPAWLKTYKSASFSPGTDEIVTVNEKGRITVWDITALTANADRSQPTVPEFGNEHSVAQMSPDGKWIAALDGGKDVSIWSRSQTQSAPRLLEGHTGMIRTVQFSRDSRWIVTASADGTARVWSVDAADPPKTLSGHASSLYSASFDSSGARVVTGGADSTIRVWDANTSAELATLRWHSEGVNDVQFSSDGQWILSASDDGTVKLGQCETCTLTIGEVRNRVEALALLTNDEREDIRRRVDQTKSNFALRRD